MAPTVKDDAADPRVSDRVSSTLRDVSEQAANAGNTVRRRFAHAADDAAEMLKDKGEKLAEEAQHFAEDVRDRVQDRIDAEQDAGADYALRVAAAMRRAAHEFEHDVPIAAHYIGLAASTVDDYAERFRDGDLHDLIEGTKDFAKRQPTAFLGLTFLAGFGLVRFLRSSAADSVREGPPDQDDDAPVRHRASPR
jgi:hypothetical protein